MAPKCGQLLIVILLLINVLIEKCLSVSQSSTGVNSEIFQENKDNEESLDIIRNKTLSGTNTRDISNNINGDFREVARKKGGSSSKEESFMDKILPVLILPFLVSSSMIPAMLLSIKFLMIKSAIIGKIAVILMLLNFFRRRVDSGGVYNHYPVDLMKEHYGFQGVEEPGVYINKKRKRRQLR